MKTQQEADNQQFVNSQRVSSQAEYPLRIITRILVRYHYRRWLVLIIKLSTSSVPVPSQPSRDAVNHDVPYISSYGYELRPELLGEVADPSNNICDQGHHCNDFIFKDYGINSWYLRSCYFSETMFIKLR